MESSMGASQEALGQLSAGNNASSVKEDDASSEHSVWNQYSLQDDLLEALDDEKIEFLGTFYHASLLTAAPNPCLQIDGLGLVGLPLSEPLAKLIISCATLAPFGHGEHTVVDKIVRDTWEIEPSRLTFLNPQWAQYLKSHVVPEVCESLGVMVGKRPPKLELYKLLLYETGSHFLPHQDTQKAEGMFATVVVILPSIFSGGQIILSHAGRTEAIDFASDSMLSTSLLAWYTDVKHEVREITSGYRLALVYNLIHNPRSGEVPRLIDPAADDRDRSLRKVLQRWKAGKYTSDFDSKVIAYVLDHEYSVAEFKSGLKGLKGIDAKRVKYLQTVAEELGYKIGLANLDHHIYGEADDYNGYDSDPPSPQMRAVGSTVTTLSNLTGLDGKVLVCPGNLDIGDEEIVPTKPFEGEEPDDKDYSGYMENGAASLDLWYIRSVVVIIPEERIEDVHFSMEGTSYALRRLKALTDGQPSPAEHEWARRLIIANGWRLEKEAIPALLDYILKWGDLSMWRSIMELSKCSLEGVGVARLLEAWKAFSSDAVISSFEELVSRSSKGQYYHYGAPQQEPTENGMSVLPWSQGKWEKILLLYSDKIDGDEPPVVTVVRLAVVQSFEDIVNRGLFSKGDALEFWVHFVKSLRQIRAQILEGEVQLNGSLHHMPGPVAAHSSDGAPTTQQTQLMGSHTRGADFIDSLIKKCVQAAASKWTGSSIFCKSSGQDLIDRFLRILDEALAIHDPDICRKVLYNLLSMPGAVATKFKEIYIPLIPRLRSFLDTNKQSLSVPPFSDFFKVLIGLYLKDVLPDTAPLRKLGCGCDDCGLLDKFIFNPELSSTTFWMVQARRSHLEYQLTRGQDLCTFITSRRRALYGIQVTKHPKILQISTWEARLKAAKAFMTSISSDGMVIAEITGQYYAEVQRALGGIASFTSIVSFSDEQTVSQMPGLKRKRSDC